MIKIPSGNHSTKQQHDLVGKLESTSVLFCSSWRYSQSPHVPFELERFQFFPLSARSRVCQTERFFTRCGRKKVPSDFVTFSLSPLLVFAFALLVCFAFVFGVSLVLCIILFNMFLFAYFFSFALFCFS